MLAEIRYIQLIYVPMLAEIRYIQLIYVQVQTDVLDEFLFAGDMAKGASTEEKSAKKV